MYVVAGVSGHVGSVVAEALLAKGQKVKVLVRDAAKGLAWSKKGAEVAQGSLEDQAFLTGALKGATGFFTLLPPNYAAPDFYAFQCATSDAIAGAVKASGVPHVVLLSSVGADLPSGTGPIKGLHYLENALRKTGTKLTAIRAGYFQENVANSLAPAKGMGVFPNFTPSADYPMPMIATKDIGALAAESLLAPAGKSEIVDLHGPAYSIRQLSDKLGQALGKPLQIVDIPQAGWVDAMVKAGLPPHVAEVYAEMYAGFASGAIVPKGDRMVQGKTTVDEVIKTLV
ncbi:MAG: NmrA family NAD(P)-binding protein [Myxococcales bacterium]|nr:NmrA family NAD(P)-binding protein [Myxococcales bacterium]